jgi:Growth factor receptor domain IV
MTLSDSGNSYETTNEACRILVLVFNTLSLQSASDCIECKHFKLGSKCVEQCPKTHYVDSTDNSTCQPCHPNCSPDAGCTGPLNGIGPGRCVGCWWARLTTDLHTIEECLPPSLQQCPDEYYEKTISINADITSNKSLPTRSRGVIRTAS